jgi:hypothetical protein
MGKSRADAEAVFTRACGTHGKMRTGKKTCEIGMPHSPPPLMRICMPVLVGPATGVDARILHASVDAQAAGHSLSSATAAAFVTRYENRKVKMVSQV